MQEDGRPDSFKWSLPQLRAYLRANNMDYDALMERVCRDRALDHFDR